MTLLEILEAYLAMGISILALMSVVWALSLVLKNASIVDIFWGPGFILASYVAFVFGTLVDWPRKVIMGLMLVAWGVRLAIHILVRNWGKGEDFRYAKWREQYGASWWWRSYFQVFLLQGLLMWVIALPQFAVLMDDDYRRSKILEDIAPWIWLAGFLIETIADAHLYLFKTTRANRGKILTSGLWYFSRHPNYFGEAVVWWGFYLFAASTGGWWSIPSPILMTWLLLRVSGVTMLERTLRGRTGYAEYMRRTSSFIPWFPKE